MKQMLSNLIAQTLKQLITQEGGTSKLTEQILSEADVVQLLEVPPEPHMGDFALPCFSMAKILRKAPNLIAEDLKNALEEKALEEKALEEKAGEHGIAKIEAVQGYLNFYMDKKIYVEHIFNQLRQPDFGISKAGTGKTICMDYSSPNIAKNFHVGHLRTTVIGNSLYQIFSSLGYDVVRINHLGDWGTQFGKLIVAYKKWSSKEQVEASGIEELLRIYVKFNDEAKEHPELNDQARSWFAKMEQGDEDAIAIWKWFKEISMIEFQRVYEMLGMEFDSYLGESFYMDKVPAVVEELKEKHLLKSSQGASIIDLEEYDMPPCLITKSDGSSIYHSRDIAALLYRKKEYDFEKCIYVTGLEQTLHFKQVFKAIELMGYDWADNLVHVPYGLVSLQGEKLSTRSGNIIYAEDILKEAVLRSKEMIEQKNPDLEEKDKVAHMVGVGAVIFHDLFNQRIKNVDFSWDDVLSFEGTTGPYVQYTYARAKSILRKSEEASVACKKTGSEDTAADLLEEQALGYTLESMDYGVLIDDVGYELVKKLAEFPETVTEAVERFEPSVVSRYVMSVAVLFNKFYHDCRILNEEENIKNARLALVDITQKVIKKCCALLGMECPEQM